jgi:cellobiose phosphorylase
MYRLLIETLLGVNLEGNQLRLTPSLPRTWSTFTLHYRYRQTTYHIRITRLPSAPSGGSRLSLDGQALAGNIISLLDDHRDHSVEMQVS